ncbi:hypothetical protein AB0D15_18465, partial [Streptomyces sp. NPDC048551]
RYVGQSHAVSLASRMRLSGRHRGAAGSAAIAAETDLYRIAEDRLLKEHPGNADWLRPSLAGMRSWMRGNLDWSRRTERYASGIASGISGAYLETALMEVGP